MGLSKRGVYLIQRDQHHDAANEVLSHIFKDLLLPAHQLDAAMTHEDV